MNKKKYVVYLGSSGFPYGLAEIQKIILISQSLVLTGNHVTVFCNRGMHKKKDHPQMEATGDFHGIEYVYTPGTPFYNENLLRRNYLKLKGVFREIALLKERKKKNQLDFAIVSTHRFKSILIYYIVSRMLGFKIVLNYVEFSSGIKKKWHQFNIRSNDWLFDQFAPKLSDGVLPISEYLIRHMKKVNPTVPYLKLAGLTDYNRYNNIEAIGPDKYFLFCGAANYKETVFFIIDSYVALIENSGKHTYLYLVINGNPTDVKDIKDYIEASKKPEWIKFFTRLTDRQLYTYYKNAIALLIPLRPNLQDIARFPHKIGEYMGSGNPVISTNVGEVRYYFKDMENMLIAADYDTKKYAEKMQIVLDQPEKVREIGLRGQAEGRILFDYHSKAAEINEFFERLSAEQ